MLADNDMRPGFLIGGVPDNFGVSAQLGDEPFFVIEADEYDTAFFDKRSKFVHYRPRTLVINNLEFDHADIFPDLAAIQTQFHHLIRTVPANGKIIYPGDEPAINDTLQQGCWSEQQPILTANSNWQVVDANADYSEFSVIYKGAIQGTVKWNLIGQHNMANALAAIVAAHHVGLAAKFAIASLSQFKGIKRRMEVKGTVQGITVYDDFAHHPTAIATTLQGLRKHVGKARIHAILELRSNTMRMGVHHDTLQTALQTADTVHVFQPADMPWDARQSFTTLSDVQISDTTDAIINAVCKQAKTGEHVIIMSNGGFENVHQRLLDALANV